MRDLAAQAFGDDGGVIGVGMGENGEKFLAAPRAPVAMTMLWWLGVRPRSQIAVCARSRLEMSRIYREAKSASAETRACSRAVTAWREVAWDPVR